MIDCELIYSLNIEKFQKILFLQQIAAIIAERTILSDYFLEHFPYF